LKGIMVIDENGIELDKDKYCINKKQKTLTCNIPKINVIAPSINNWTFNISTFSTLVINNNNIIHCQYHNNIICQNENIIHCTYGCTISACKKNTILTCAETTISCQSNNNITTMHDANIKCWSDNTITCGDSSLINCKSENIIGCGNDCSINGLDGNSVLGKDHCHIYETEHVEAGRSRLTIGKYGTLRTNISEDKRPEIYNIGKCLITYMKGNVTKMKIIKGKG